MRPQLPGHRSFRMHKFNDVRIADTVQEVSRGLDGSIRFEASAGNMKDLRKALKGFKRKHPEFDLEIEDAVKMARYEEIHEKTRLKQRVIVSFPRVEKSVIKTAMCWAFATGLEPQDCDLSHPIMKSAKQSKYSPLISVLPDSGPLVNRNAHSVAVRKDGEASAIFAVVEYYGWMRFLVPLSSRYVGETKMQLHSINVSTGEIIELV